MNISVLQIHRLTCVQHQCLKVYGYTLKIFDYFTKNQLLGAFFNLKELSSIQMGGKIKIGRVAFPEGVPIHLNFSFLFTLKCQKCKHEEPNLQTA